MTKRIRIALLLLGAVLLGIGVPVPAYAAPPGNLCPNPNPGYANDIVYQGVRIHSALPCQWLDAGRSWTFGNARLTMQTDGNLVIYDRSNRARWASGTSGSGATQMLFQWDGNLVLYKPGWTSPVWSSRTYNRCTGVYSPTINLQADSNYVIYCRWYHDSTYSMYPIWATGTVF